MIIKFDGIDGCGKSTVCRAAADQLADLGHSVTVIGEFTSPMRYQPGSAEATSIPTLAIREAALDPEFDCDDVERQLLLHFLSRRKNRVEITYLDTVNDFVVVDRSTLSNFAYAAALDERFRALSAFVMDGVETADHLFWIDTPVEVCMGRMSGRRRDAVELKGPGYFHRTREQFQAAVERHRAHTLDGRAGVADLAAQVIATVAPV
jgi:thymidylate kinase